MKLTDNAKLVLEKRYLWKDAEGRSIESPDELFARVAGAVASVESRDRRKWAERFREFMVRKRFLPNSPTLMNAGREGGQLSACFVLPVDDSLDGIFDTLKQAAKIHQSGGGTGFSFSRLRPAGAIVGSTKGVASGPVSFMKIFDVATETIKQGGARRGANMGILRVDHPDVVDFIDCKRDMRSVVNFNISVALTEEFMRSVANGSDYWLRDPRTGQGVRRISAQGVFGRMVQAAWECGDPGVVFLDRINQMNPTPRAGLMESTNPCGEQPLLPYESCNLGSLNLGEYWQRGRFDWEKLRQDVQLAIRFLDNVVDLNAYPIPECEKITLKNRKIGLGVMGFADLLLMMGIPYSSEDALNWAERLMSFVDGEGKKASADLAKKRGPFPNWKGSLWERLGYPPLRNATVSTVAPTGTISIIAGCSSGIEPIFSGVFFRNVLSGERLREVHPAVERAIRERQGAMESWDDEEISRILGPSWSPAQRVPLEAHVRMQAVFQRFSDSAVSKTVNLPESATPEEIARAYILAYESGCKGITVYRDRSRPLQVLEAERPAAAPAACLDC